MTTPKTRLPILMLGVLGISVSAILVRFSAPAPSPVTAAWRLIWAVLLLTPMVFCRPKYRQELPKVTPKDLLLSTLSGLFLAGHFVLWFQSLKMTSVASAATIVCTEVIWVSIGFCLFLKGQISPKAIASITITILGSLLIALSDSSGTNTLLGDALALAAAILAAAYMLLGRVVQQRTSTTVYTYLVYFACAIALILTCLVQNCSLIAWGWRPILIGLGLAVFSTLLGHSIMSWGMNYFSPSFVSACKLCEPVLASIMAVFLFQEVPGPMQLLGGVLILVGVYWYSQLETR